MNTTVTIQSKWSGKPNTMDIPLTKDKLAEGYEAYRNGAHIQDAFPTLDVDQREFLLTGATPEEWDAMFPEDDES